MKRTLLVASAGLFGCIVIACSSNSDAPSEGGTSTSGSLTSSSGGSSSSSSGGSSSSSSSSSASSSSTSGAPACGPVAVAKNAMDADYRPAPAPTKGACTPADLKLLESAAADPSAKSSNANLLSLFKAANPSGACQTCLIGNYADPEWKTLVENYPLNGGGTGVYLNLAPCGVGHSASKKAACGEHTQKFRYCYIAACNDCTEESTFAACRTAAYGTGSVCETASQQWRGDCPSADVIKTANECKGVVFAATAACGD
jgi:hypothetical protein